MTKRKILDVLNNQISNSELNESEVLDVILNVISEELIEKGVVSIEEFGVFKTQKRNEYISLNSKTGDRYLMPPAIEIVFESYLYDFELFEKTVNRTEYFNENDNHVFNENEVESDDYAKRFTLTFEPDTLLINGVNSAFVNFEPTLLNEGVDLPGLLIVSDDPEIPDDIEELGEHEVPDELKAHSISKDAETSGFDGFEVNQADVIIPPTTKHDILYPHKRSPHFKRSSLRVLIPVIGGIAIAMTALFFFDAIANKRDKY